MLICQHRYVPDPELGSGARISKYKVQVTLPSAVEQKYFVVLHIP